MTEIKLASRKRSASLNLHPNWKKCLCHVAESRGKLTLFTEKSWERFEKCSLRRNDHIWLTIMNHWRGGPKGGYHRQCDQSYTNVGNIPRIKGLLTRPSLHLLIKKSLQTNQVKSHQQNASIDLMFRDLILINASFARWRNVNVERERDQGKL